MQKLSCLLVGDETLCIQCGEIVRQRGHEIVAVVTSSKAVADWAAASQIPSLALSEITESWVDGVAFDWLFSIANLKVLPDFLWKKASSGAVNFHDGPLPDMAGLNTPAWAILEGRQTHGITWHAMTSGIDEGDIYLTHNFGIDDEETSLTLNTKCLEAGMATFGPLVDGLAGNTLEAKPQDLQGRRYYARTALPAANGLLNFSETATQLSRLVRALDFGPGYTNPIATPKISTADGVFTVLGLQVLEDQAEGRPGTVVAVADDHVVVSAADRLVRLQGVRVRGGVKTSLASVVAKGASLQPVAHEMLEQQASTIAKYDQFFSNELAAFSPVSMPGIGDQDPAKPVEIGTEPLEGVVSASIVAAFVARVSGSDSISITYCDDALRSLDRQFTGFFAPALPLNVAVADDMSCEAFDAQFANRVRRVASKVSYASDIFVRRPYLKEQASPIGLIETSRPSEANLLDGTAITFAIDPSHGAGRLIFDKSRISPEQVQLYRAWLGAFSADYGGNTALGSLPLMLAAQRDLLLDMWNRSERDYDRSVGVHTLIERQAEKSPDAIALVCGSEAVTYHDMNARADRVANGLIRLGVGADSLVGLHLPRSVDLVVAALGILKAGGAYVPLDPQFPADRIEMMVEDARIELVLTDSELMRNQKLAKAAKLITVNDLVASTPPGMVPIVQFSPNNLAYVIFTSGSTGRPKGVMIEHQNVVNFFVGMDDRVPMDSGAQPTWLAVTSLSFDISVLELFWTLTRGFKVVIHNGRGSDKAGSQVRADKGGMEFSLFYWGNDDGYGSGKYRLLLEGAKFADENGFTAIWTPERHFHAFGGPYPNPAVTGAAVAALTKNLSIRAGSCVLPLHHPLRVAEEWAVIDNLSNGRAGAAFASGWMPEDFVLRPENAPPKNKASLIRDIDVVRRLWRGESVEFDFGAGKVGVVTQPRPVQKDLPIWLTTAGNPESYRDAARVGANVLTHLLGQSIDELADKIKIYRDTLTELGHDPANFKVTLMLHTLLGDDREEVREKAREPMKDYLRSAAALIKQYAWAFPAFKKPPGVNNPLEVDLQTLSAEEMDAILEFAFMRYFEDSGLFGTLADAQQRVSQLKAIGVDEIACLIDFGVATDVALSRLEFVAQLTSGSSAPTETADTAAGFAADVAANNVTHLQCTPSMARMFLMDDENRQALGRVKHLFIGGEALSARLIADLRSATTATIENMYGPTETTIWSSTHSIDPGQDAVPLGQPIANTQLYVLDRSLRLAPTGMPGELYIGGDGVARGYLNRPDLTDERFIKDLFRGDRGRLYRTGDLVHRDGDGTIIFLGRVDHQVKVRGYRIELGEIENGLMELAEIEEAVVIAREDQADDVRLVAYYRSKHGPANEASLRTHLASKLPDYMVPSHFVHLQSFPLTPNAKVDRKKLPSIRDLEVERPKEFVAPTDGVQKAVAAIFKQALGLERVGLLDNFFALGGHSLLAVQVHRELKATVSPELSITDLFRFPTVAGLAEHVAGGSGSSSRLNKVADRAAMRRQALGDRHAGLRARETG